MLFVSLLFQIKRINPSTCVIETLAGSGSAGMLDGDFTTAEFNEPGGLCIGQGGKKLYVADTNNHTIRVLDLEEKIVSQVHTSESTRKK